MPSPFNGDGHVARVHSSITESLIWKSAYSSISLQTKLSVTGHHTEHPTLPGFHFPQVTTPRARRLASWYLRLVEGVLAWIPRCRVLGYSYLEMWGPQAVSFAHSLYNQPYLGGGRSC